MSIDETDEVDFLWKDGERGRVVVTISDHRDWEDEGEHLLLLQEKLNTYFYFIESWSTRGEEA